MTVEADMLRARFPGDVWPFGAAACVCPRCNGTGSDRAKLQAAIVHSRRPEIDRSEYLCQTCHGRGRVLEVELEKSGGRAH